MPAYYYILSYCCLISSMIKVTYYFISRTIKILVVPRFRKKKKADIHGSSDLQITHTHELIFLFRGGSKVIDLFSHSHVQVQYLRQRHYGISWHLKNHIHFLIGTFSARLYQSLCFILFLLLLLVTWLGYEAIKEI